MIVVAIVVDLANMAYKFIAVEKDWFVVVTAGDTASLASRTLLYLDIDELQSIYYKINKCQGDLQSSVHN